MRYPNQRYGSKEEFAYYTMGRPVREIAKMLKRSEKSVVSWLKGDRKIPWWIPEYLRMITERNPYLNSNRKDIHAATRFNLMLIDNTARYECYQRLDELRAAHNINYRELRPAFPTVSVVTMPACNDERFKTDIDPDNQVVLLQSKTRLEDCSASTVRRRSYDLVKPSIKCE